MSDRFSVVWQDFEREPKCDPNPDFPDGKDVVLPMSPIAKSCKVVLDCPAPRCGAYQVQCRECGIFVTITTAGRPDDPRSVTMPCRSARMN